MDIEAYRQTSEEEEDRRQKELRDRGRRETEGEVRQREKRDRGN